MKKQKIKSVVKNKSDEKMKIYKLNEHQISNIILAARGQSACDKADRFVSKIEKKYKLNPNFTLY